MEKYNDSQYIKELYFNYLINLVYDTSNGISYFNLFNYLHSIPFEYSVEEDYDQACHGLELRHTFANSCYISNSDIDAIFEMEPCTIFELMVGLSCNMEMLMDDDNFGNRTSQWFWGMIVNLGLNNMDDDNFNEMYCHDVLYKFINRDYDYYGNGGLFFVKNPLYDMRTVNLWMQAMWFLSENFDFDLC